MSPAQMSCLQALQGRLPHPGASALSSALALVLSCAAAPMAAAQDGAAPGMATARESEELPDREYPDLDIRPGEIIDPAPADTQAPPPSSTADGERTIDFESDALSYDSEADIVSADGNVVLRSENQSVRADQVRWNRKSGQIFANGNVRFVDQDGNQLFTESVELTDEFEAGAMEDLLIALREGGRLAARSGERGEDGSIVLTDAAYSACEVVDPDGCPKRPSWRITADRVVYVPEERRVRFRGAMLELFGARLIPLPGLAIRTDGRAESGVLIPDLRFSKSNGVEVSGSYYWRVADNKDLTLGAYLYSDAPPMASAQWRHLTGRGAYQVTGYLTNSRRISDFTGVTTTERDTRGYLFANGKFQFDEHWSATGSIRRASDRTFLRRYDISRDDRLRSTVNVERIDDKSYLSIAGWATQTLRLADDQGQVPTALPVIDYRRKFDDPLLGGQVQLQLNSLNIVRDEGQDTQRAFAGAQWNLRRLTEMGQVVTLTGRVRGDVYHTDETGLTATASYRGNPGWETRAIALAAIDVEWPLVGQAFGGTQVLTPRVQIVASPPIRNLAVPNEDSRAIDLEDSNLFALNRFPGYDRVEDGARVTYGVDWQWQRPGLSISTTIGQSYRLKQLLNIYPDGTGLSERWSDFVGRTEIRFRDFIKLTHRFRLDKDNLAVRRNEFDATVGSSKTYIEAGYLKLDRNISTVEDLQDREELRFAARVAFANYWSIFGAGIFNLTDRNEDPVYGSDGFEPIRTRLGVAYQDDCLELGLTWRRDYVTSGDSRRGDTYQLYFSLRNLGFR